MENAIEYRVFVNPIKRLFHFICNLFYSMYFASFNKMQSTAQEINNETMNQQAERFLNNYGNSILRLAYSYLHNMSDAEEILQDTILQYLKKTPTFESIEHEKAWLLHIAANLSKNKIKYNKIRYTDEMNEELIYEQRQDLSFVWEAVKGLSNKYREVIHLYYYEGYTTVQIANILKRNESTIRSDLRRGREKLKKILKEMYDFE